MNKCNSSVSEQAEQLHIPLNYKYYLHMKDKTIDYILRATWQAVARMYNEEASNYGATMATGFALLSIDKENGTPSTTLGPKMGMEATSLNTRQNRFIDYFPYTIPTEYRARHSVSTAAQQTDT